MRENTLSTSEFRFPGLLLILSMVGFILLMVIVIGMVLSVFPKGMNSLTPSQMVSFRGVFVLSQVLPIIPFLLGTLGITLLYPPLKSTSARSMALLGVVCAWLTVAFCSVMMILRVTLVGFSDPTLGNNAIWQWTTWAYEKPLLVLPALATFFMGIALYQSGLLRRAGLVVAILSGLLALLALFSGYPPFVFGFLWLAIGIGLFGRKSVSLQGLPQVSG